MGRLIGEGEDEDEVNQKVKVLDVKEDLANDI